MFQCDYSWLVLITTGFYYILYLTGLIPSPRWTQAWHETNPIFTVAAPRRWWISLSLSLSSSLPSFFPFFFFFPPHLSKDKLRREHRHPLNPDIPLCQSHLCLSGNGAAEHPRRAFNQPYWLASHSYGCLCFSLVVSNWLTTQREALWSASQTVYRSGYSKCASCEEQPKLNMHIFWYWSKLKHPGET